MSVDAAVALVASVLRDSIQMPAGMSAERIRVHELLPNETSELPLVGIYLVDDRPIREAAEGMSNREAVIQVETRVLMAQDQDALSSTKAYRTWSCREILPSLAHQTGIEGAEYGDYKPFGVAGVDRLGGALQEFVIPYFFDPEED